AAATSETSAELAFAFGIASLGSLGTAVYRAHLAGTLPSGLPAQVAEAARDSLASAMATAGGLPDPLAALVLASSRDAFTSGMHVVAALSAVILLGVAVLALTLLSHIGPIGATASEGRVDRVSSEVDTAPAGVLT